MTKLHELSYLGQAIWLDYISRSLITTGQLTGMVEKGIRGLTSNPTIFEKAIAGSSDYDREMKRLAGEGKSVEEIYEALALNDIADAADTLRPIYDRTNGEDGYVSLEVSPLLAHDTEGTIADGRRLYRILGRPNIMIKVPATPEGMPAIETLIGDGINVNATLIFSLAHYQAVAGAYLNGLEILAGASGDLSRVGSVASFFISRIDTAVDKELDKYEVSELQGKTAIASAKIAYGHFMENFHGERWVKLALKKARVQRPLWASTGTKNPLYPDTLYLDSLIGPDTVNTVPLATMEAFIDHGTVARTIDTDLEEAYTQLIRLDELGINLDAITQKLQDDGVASFAQSFETLLSSIAGKIQLFTTGV
jgi:transaldolase